MGERPTLMRLPMALRPLTWLAARVYGVAVGWRNARLSKGIGVGEIRVRGVGIGVISVGNITVGGTGKSPFVAWICGEIARLGRRPVIGMRGYTPGLVRRNAGGSSMALLCDEAQEYALTAPMALVVAHPKRRRALIAELSREVHAPWIDGAVVVLDDGFQHRFVARALDIVLVDATRTGLDGDLLPNGILREPAGNLARADIVVLTKAHDLAQRARGRVGARGARSRCRCGVRARMGWHRGARVRPVAARRIGQLVGAARGDDGVRAGKSSAFRGNGGRDWCAHHCTPARGRSPGDAVERS